MIENEAKTIMVVDDDETVLSFLTFSLKGEGFNVLECKNAESALQKLKTSKPHLFLLDIMLPHMNGFALCKKIRSDTQFETTPVLFITAYADPTSLSRTAEAGAQGLIEKPIMFSELLAQIMDALAGRFSLPTRLKYGA